MLNTLIWYTLKRYKLYLIIFYWSLYNLFRKHTHSTQIILPSPKNDNANWTMIILLRTHTTLKNQFNYAMNKVDCWLRHLNSLLKYQLPEVLRKRTSISEILGQISTYFGFSPAFNSIFSLIHENLTHFSDKKYPVY